MVSPVVMWQLLKTTAAEDGQAGPLQDQPLPIILMLAAGASRAMAGGRTRVQTQPWSIESCEDPKHKGWIRDVH